MKITKRNVAHWLAWLALTLCLMANSAVSAMALDISGTVSYGGSKTGQIYLGIYSQDGNSTGLGTSIAAPGSYTIRGVQSGTYTVRAFMDTLGYGTSNTVDPLGESVPVTVVGTSLSGIGVSLFDTSPTLPPQAPPGVMVTPGDGSVLVMWDTPEDANGFEAATSYNVYWSTSSNVMGTYGTSGGSVTGIPARDDGHAFLPFTNGSELFFAVTSQIGASSSTAAVTPSSTIVGVPSPVGSTTVSGTVSYSGTPPGGPLFIGINPANSGPVAYTIIAAPTYPQAFTVSGVPAGSYNVFAFIDANDSGMIDPGDSHTSRSQEPLILVSGTALTGIDIQLNGAGASVSTATTHTRDNVSDWYNLQFEATGNIKRPLKLTLNSGPNISGPLDIGLSPWGDFQYSTGVPRPNVGDTYNFTVTYSEGSETVFSPVTAVLDSFVNPLSPVGNTYGPTATAPTFAWEPSATPPPPAVYTYGLRLSRQFDWVWDVETMPLTQLSVDYNNDSRAVLPTLALGTTYTWTAMLRDANGNQSEQQVSFTPQSTTAPTGSAAGTYTYNSGTGQLTLNWTSVSFICDGPSIGQEIQNVTLLSETTLSWTNGTDSMTWTRPSGTAGDIVGTWTTTDPSSGNSYSVTFNANGTLTVGATIYQCSNPQPQISGFTPDAGPVGSRITITGANFDGNQANNTVMINGAIARVVSASSSQLTVVVLAGSTTGPISVTTQSGTGTSAANFTVGPAPGSGNGTYTYVPGSPGTLTLNWTTVNYPCDGPAIGTEIQSVTTLDATTMVWQDGMTWSRISAEPSGLLGIWHSSDPGTGNSYTVTFYGDNTMTVSSGAINQCSGDFQPPTVPTGVTAQAVSPTRIDINWNPSTDNNSVNYYQVYRNGSPAGQPVGQNNTYWFDTPVSPSTTYTYTVAACDFDGNCSAQSAPAQATTPAIPYSMIYGGVTHLANSDTYGTPVDVLQIGIGKAGSSLGGMTATVSGPNGFSYTFSDADVRPYLGGQFEVYKEFTSPLDTGVYTFTLNDGSGTISNRVDTHITPVNLPAVDSATIQAQRKSDGSYRFTWAPVNDTKTYFYSLRINRADGTLTPVFNGARKMDGYEDVPAGTLTDGVAYEVRVRVGDGPDFSLTFNQANSVFVPFTPQASDYNANRLMFNYVNANNVSGGNPTFGFRMCTAAPSPACTTTQATLVSSYTITGPAGFNVTGSYTNATPSTDLTSPNNVDFSHAFAGAPVGSYILDVTANGIHHYAYMTLTPAVSYPAPVSANYKAEYTDGTNSTIRFSWADVDQTGALYYRVFVQDFPAGATAYYSSSRTNQAFVDVPKANLGSLTNKRWRVEVYDSSSAFTQRNRINGGWTANGSLNLLPAYDSTKPAISQFRFRSLNHPGGSATDISVGATDDTSPLGSVLVSGPGSYSRNLLLGAGGGTGTGPYSYSYSMVEAGAPAAGLYSLGVTDGSANSVTRYNQQPTPHDVPLADFRTFRVSLDANGDSRFSWAPVVTDVPVWYSLELVAVNTMTTISTGLNNVQQASVTITAANMQTALMQGPLMFRIRVNDGSGWSTSNNVSQSAYVGYSVNYDYSTLTDSDSDGFASDIDPNDGDPTINPYAAAGGSYAISGRVTDQGSAPLAGIFVMVLNGSSLDFVNSATTDSSGYYAVAGLPAGSYKVQFIDQSLTYDTAWYSGAHDGNSAATISLYGPALTTFTANAALTTGQTGGISGRVTDGTTGIAGIRVGAFRASNMAYAAGAITDADGYFVIGGLTTDSYKVIFVGSDAGYQDLWYNGAATPDAATPVSVTAPNYTININGTLARSTTTTVVLASGGNPSYAGDPVTFTASVSPVPAGGTVQFKVDGVNVGGPIALVGGSATSAAITSLLPGVHTITAEYSGGTGYAGSISAGASQTANPKVKIGSNGDFLTLQAAINAALNTNILLLRDTRYAENLLVNATASRPAPFTITLKGGLSSDFTTPAATFTSVRKLTVKDGKVIASRVAVKPD